MQSAGKQAAGREVRSGGIGASRGGQRSLSHLLGWSNKWQRWSSRKEK